MIQKLSPYWKCQFGGWGLATSYWVYFMIINPGMTILEGTINTALTLIACIGITHLYYRHAHKQKWITLDLNALIPRVIIGTIVLASLFVLLMIPINYLTNAKCDGCNFMDHIQEGWLRYSMTGLRLMAIWILAFHMYHYARAGARAETEKAQLSEQYSLAQLEKLKGQLNPHFLFNALNSVKSLINSDQEKAKRATVLLSDILRNSLNVAQKKWITLAEEIQQVKDYLELEQMRFEERLIVQYDIDPKLLDRLIPPLSLQILIENAIKHGISKLESGGKIIISVHQVDEKLDIIVSNSGALNQKSASTKEHYGLNNLEKRLTLLFNNEANFKIAQQGQMVVAQISLPSKVKHDSLSDH